MTAQEAHIRADDRLLAAIGNTPMESVDLRIDGRWRDIRLKLEGANPFGSIKDRTALSLLTDLEDRDRLTAESVLIESTSGNLFQYAKDTLKVDFPIDEWFYGAARVRQPLRYWETALMLSSAFGLTPPPLTPIQFPFAAGEPWRALEFPDKPALTSDRLLYTCLYSQAFNPAARQCGVLVDEWTEVIPATSRDTAITFNYARPDNEPPQAMLLVVSASNTGSWQWADLVAALNETLDLAKKRAVEPAFLDATAYTRFLPATVSASTSYGINIATTFTVANGVMHLVEGGSRA